MKKLLCILLLAVMTLFMFTACNETPTADQNGDTKPVENPTGSDDDKQDAADEPEEKGDDTSAPTGGQGKLDKILAEGKIVMVTSPDFAPSEFIDYTKTGQEQYVGADITLGYYIAEHLGVELEIKAMDFGAVLTSITTGTADMAISGLAWKPERAESMGLSDTFDYESESLGHGLIVPVSEIDNYKSLEDFSGKKIAAQVNSLQYGFCEEQLPEDVEIQPISNLADAVMMLQTGKVDAIASAHTSGLLLVKNIQDSYDFCNIFFEYESEGTVVAVTKGEDALLEAINEALAKAKEENVLPGFYSDAKELADSLGIE